MCSSFWLASVTTVAVNAYLPLDAKIKKILDIVDVIAVVLWRLRSFGILDPLPGIRVGR
jgi:hypothetical protein